MLGDHGLYGKGTLYKEALNPALIVSYPKAFGAGVVVARPVELLDFVRTCLDVDGIKHDIVGVVDLNGDGHPDVITTEERALA